MKDEKRDVVYEEVGVNLYSGEHAMTEEIAKEIIGWEEEEDGKFKGDYDLTTPEGTKVRCNNNINNRPLTMTDVQRLSQEILRGNWELNGESIILGNTGTVLNGQHRLIAFILACSSFRKDPSKYPAWTTSYPPVLEVLVCTGVSEDRKTVDTMDTCKPRTLADVLFCSPHFAELTKQERKKVSRIASYCIKFLWDRTGVPDAYGLYKTHKEYLDFLERHNRIVEAVQFIYDEEDGKRIQSLAGSLGSAAGLLYLMASGKTNPKDYHETETRDEESLNFELWDTACEFWTHFVGGGEDFSKLREAIYATEEISQTERTAFILKGWSLYAEEKPLTAVGVKLQYKANEDGEMKLAEFPTAGGIDVGPSGVYEPSTVEDIEERKEQEREAKRKRAGRRTAKKPVSKKPETETTAKKTVKKRTPRRKKSTRRKKVTE